MLILGKAGCFGSGKRVASCLELEPPRAVFFEMGGTCGGFVVASRAYAQEGSMRNGLIATVGGLNRRTHS